MKFLVVEKVFSFEMLELSAVLKDNNVGIVHGIRMWYSILHLSSLLLFSGCMYSMAAFGPVLGFLLGAYLLSFHMDSFSSSIVTIGNIHKSPLS